MKKYFRILISILVVLGLVLVARSQAAGAQLPSGTELSISAEDQGSLSLHGPGDDDDDDHHKGTVKPPPSKRKICKKGVYSVGGTATIKVTRLSRHYCIHTDLKKRTHVSGHIPQGAGKLLSDVVVLQVFYRNDAISRLPDKAGEAQICFAVPPGKKATIYFLNTFKKKDGKPTWVPISTKVKNGLACTGASLSGSYALIGK
jgi:hypothetical protein